MIGAFRKAPAVAAPLRAVAAGPTRRVPVPFGPAAAGGPIRRAAVLVAVALVLAVAAAPAAAEYAPGAVPASATATALSARESNAPAISRDGRYVVFETESQVLLGPSPDPSTPLTVGLVRKDLVSGAVELVGPPGSAGPASLSADGRYVLFETDLPLVPGDSNLRTDVYLRDMTRALTDVAAYELVSSLDGPERSPTYRVAGTGSHVGRQGFALSADGRSAAFWTNGESNLPAGAATAPRAQVLVRRLDAAQTVLVTHAEGDPATPVPPAGAFAAQATPLPALSGDGTTVAWLDTNPAPQIAHLPGESTGTAALLWRRLADTATRRVTGVADPDDPDCPPGSAYKPDPAASGPCYGPFTTSEAENSAGIEPANYPLSISDDGLRVGFFSDARRRGVELAFQRRGFYVVDMRPGVSRKAATSEPVTLSKAISDLRPIQEATLSPDGRHVVLASRNNAFDGPRPIGTFPSGELAATNVYVLDLDANALERATRGWDGGDYRGPLLDPLSGGGTDDTFVAGLSASTDAGAVAFVARDGNLFVGDANAVGDVQVVRRAETFVPGGVELPPAETPPPPPLPRITPLKPIHPLIGYVRVGRGGVATLRVRVPAAGRLTAAATGRAGRARVDVAAVSRRLRRPASVTLRLAPSRQALRTVRRAAKLAVSVRLRYAPRDGAATNATRTYTLTRGGLR